MLPITKMLDINVKIQAASLSRLAFGVPLIFDTENVLNASPTEGIVRTFTSLSDMVDAGYQPYNAAYKQAKSCWRNSHIRDRKSTRLNSSHIPLSRMPSSA